MAHSDKSDKSGKSVKSIALSNASSTETDWGKMGNNNKDEFLVEMSKDDPEHPLNWPMWRKLYHTLLYGFVTFTSMYNSSCMSPVIPDLMEEFEQPRIVATLTITLFVFGLAFGPLLFGPISEVYGRKLAVCVPFALMVAFTLGTAASQNIGALLITRSLAGILAAAPVVVTGGVMADIFPVTQRAVAMVLYAFMVAGGTMCAPVLSALLAEAGTWRWVCWFVSIVGGFMLILTVIFARETYLPVVLARKARALRFETKCWALHAKHEEWQLTLKEFFKVHFARPVAMMGTPIVFCMAVLAAYVYGVMYLTVTSVAATFQNERGWGKVQSQLPLLGLFLGSMLGGAFNIIGNLHYTKHVRLHGSAIPEKRFITMLYTCWMLPAGIFIFGWTSDKQFHWICPVFGLMVIGIGFLTCHQGIVCYVVDAFLAHSASAMATNTFSRSALGAAFPLFGHNLFDTMGVAWGASIIGFIALGMIPIPYVLYFFGKRIRAKNPYSNSIE